MSSGTIATGLSCFISISEMELAVRLSAAKLVFDLLRRMETGSCSVLQNRVCFSLNSSGNSQLHPLLSNEYIVNKKFSFNLYYNLAN